MARVVYFVKHIGRWVTAKCPLVVLNGNSLKMSSNIGNRHDSSWKKGGNRQLSQVLRIVIFCFVTIVWSEVECISFPDCISVVWTCVGSWPLIQLLFQFWCLQERAILGSGKISRDPFQFSPKFQQYMIVLERVRTNSRGL